MYRRKGCRCRLDQSHTTRARSISEWNRTIESQAATDRRCKRAVQAYLYPVYGGRPRIVHLPMKAAFDFDGDVPRYADDVDVRRWFPFGYQSEHLSSVPVFGDNLRNPYTIFYSQQTTSAVINECLKDFQDGYTHRGNVIVVRHGTRNQTSITNVYPAERGLIDILVSRWLEVQEEEDTEGGSDSNSD